MHNNTRFGSGGTHHGNLLKSLATMKQSDLLILFRKPTQKTALAKTKTIKTVGDDLEADEGEMDREGRN